MEDPLVSTTLAAGMRLPSDQEYGNEEPGSSSQPTVSPVGSGLETSSNELSHDGFDASRPSTFKSRAKGRSAQSKAAPRTSNAENQARYRARCKVRGDVCGLVHGRRRVLGAGHAARGGPRMAGRALSASRLFLWGWVGVNQWMGVGGWAGPFPGWAATSPALQGVHVWAWEPLHPGSARRATAAVVAWPCCWSPVTGPPRVRVRPSPSPRRFPPPPKPRFHRHTISSLLIGAAR